MIARNLEARIARLEVSRRRPDELLLVWRRQGTDAQAAVDAYRHLFAHGDPVISAEWLGEGEPPAPRWHCDFPKGLTDIEVKYLHRSLRNLCADMESRRDPE